MDLVSASDLPHVATKFGGMLAIVVGAPSYLFGMVASEWGAIATGTSIGVIGAGFAVVGLLKDKQIVALRRQADGLVEELEDRRKRWIVAERKFDEIECKLVRAETQLEQAKKWKCPSCDMPATPDPDVEEPARKS